MAFINHSRRAFQRHAIAKGPILGLIVLVVLKRSTQRHMICIETEIGATRPDVYMRPHLTGNSTAAL